MNSQLTKAMATIVFALGLGACNTGSGMGSGTELTVEPGTQRDFSERSDALIYHVDPPECYGLREYYKWVCEDGAWELDWAGQRDIWCDGTVIVVGQETDCYTDFATYNCDTHGACGSLQHVCPAHPRRFCRPQFVGDFPTMFAP
jgi:hypothetical protein